MLKYLAASVLLAFLCVPASAQTVASCPTAAAGSAWPSGSWLPCSSPATYLSATSAQPVSATALVSDMRCPAAGACVFTWQPASAVLPTDGVWAVTAAAPTGQWVLAKPPNFVTQTTPPPSATYDAQAVISWTAPPAFTDGTSINVPLTYNVYRGTSPTALTKLTSVTGLTYTDPAGSATPTTYYYAISATCSSCTEGAESALVNKTIAAPALKPGAPAATIH